jgi:tetratricopeptide (TPR) repeat protein
MGTAAYVAPEQALDARTADIRADIYSLGCTLYFLLSGRPPFVEETEVKVVLAQIENQAVPIHVIRPDVPTSLSSIVEKMLAKDPGERYQTPAEVAKALSHFLDGVKGVDQSTSVTKQVVIEDINSPIEEKKAQKITGIESHQINQEIAQTNSLVPKQKRSRIPWVLSILGAIMASLTIVYFVVIRVNTKVGTVVIEVDQPSAEVYIDGNLIMVTSPTEKDPIEVKVAEGSHELKVSKGGFQGYTQKFTVTANGKEAIKVSLEQEVQEEVQTPQEDTFLLEKPETQSNLASEYFARKDFSGAAREATKALMQNPKDVSALVARGRAYSMIASERRTSGKNSKVEFDLAIDDYTEAIKLDPFNKDAYAGRIKCYCRINKNNAALKDCNEMIRIDPYDVRGYFMRGETYGIFMNDHAKGLADLNKAMKMSPDASVYITRGRVYLLMKAYDKAISDLTEGLRLGPDKRNRMIGEKALKDAQDSIKKARKKGK